MIDLDVVMESVHFEVLPPTVDGRITGWNSSWGPIRFETLAAHPVSKVSSV